MSEEEAINILIGQAVCINPKLHCDNDCPFYEEDKDCKYIDKEFELEEAIKILKEKKKKKK